MKVSQNDLESLESLKFGGHQFKVICPYTFVERSDLYGQVNFDNCEIRVGVVTPDVKPRPVRATIETLLHERLHVVDAKWHVDLKEEQVGALSEGLFAFLIDNGFLETDDEEG